MHCPSSVRKGCMARTSSCHFRDQVTNPSSKQALSRENTCPHRIQGSWRKSSSTVMHGLAERMASIALRSFCSTRTCAVLRFRFGAIVPPHFSHRYPLPTVRCFSGRDMGLFIFRPLLIFLAPYFFHILPIPYFAPMCFLLHPCKVWGNGEATFK